MSSKRTTLKFMPECLGAHTAILSAFAEEAFIASSSDHEHHVEVSTVLNGGIFGKFEWVDQSRVGQKEGRQIFMKNKKFKDTATVIKLPAIFPSAYDEPHKPQQPRQSFVLCPRHVCYASSYGEKSQKKWHGKVKVWVFRGLNRQGEFVYEFVEDPECAEHVERTEGFLTMTSCNNSNYDNTDGDHQAFSEFGPPRNPLGDEGGMPSSTLGAASSASASSEPGTPGTSGLCSQASQTFTRGRGRPKVQMKEGYNHPEKMYGDADRYHIFLLDDTIQIAGGGGRAPTMASGSKLRWVLAVYKHMQPDEWKNVFNQQWSAASWVWSRILSELGEAARGQFQLPLQQSVQAENWDAVEGPLLAFMNRVAARCFTPLDPSVHPVNPELQHPPVEWVGEGGDESMEDATEEGESGGESPPLPWEIASPFLTENRTDVSDSQIAESAEDLASLDVPMDLFGQPNFTGVVPLPPPPPPPPPPPAPSLAFHQIQSVPLLPAHAMPRSLHLNSIFPFAPADALVPLGGDEQGGIVLDGEDDRRLTVDDEIMEDADDALAAAAAAGEMNDRSNFLFEDESDEQSRGVLHSSLLHSGEEARGAAPAAAASSFGAASGLGLQGFFGRSSASLHQRSRAKEAQAAPLSFFQPKAPVVEGSLEQGERERGKRDSVASLFTPFDWWQQQQQSVIPNQRRQDLSSKKKRAQQPLPADMQKMSPLPSVASVPSASRKASAARGPPMGLESEKRPPVPPVSRKTPPPPPKSTADRTVISQPTVPAAGSVSKKEGGGTKGVPENESIDYPREIKRLDELRVLFTLVRLVRGDAKKFVAAVQAAKKHFKSRTNPHPT